jgi:hypothetical protein
MSNQPNATGTTVGKRVTAAAGAKSAEPVEDERVEIETSLYHPNKDSTVRYVVSPPKKTKLSRFLSLFRSKDDLADDEFSKLKKQSGEYAARIALLPLTPAERSMAAKVALTFHDIRAEGKANLLTGTRVYFAAILFGVLAPVLTALQGEETFGEDAQFVMRMISIALGAAALVLNTLDSVYKWRQRGAAYLDGGNQIKRLFENFCALSGELFDPPAPPAAPAQPPTDWEALKKVPPYALKAFVENLSADKTHDDDEPSAATSSTPTHSGAQFRLFYAEFSRLQGLAREARFEGLDGSADASAEKLIIAQNGPYSYFKKQ